MVAAAVVGVASVAGSAYSANQQKKAAAKASEAQQQTAGSQIEESQRQFDEIKALLAPYTETGVEAMTVQKNLLGLGGPEAQQQALLGLQGSPQMQALTQQGENALLQQASATGGLRGGNLQSALAQFRPNLLNQMIQQQIGNLGNLTSIGQNAAAGVGNAGMQSSQQIQNALGQAGAAQAGSALAAGQANANMIGGISNTASMLGMMKLMGKF